MVGLTHDDLSIEVLTTASPPCVHLSWRGRCGPGADTGVLGPYLTAAVDEAVARDASLELHFHQLERLGSGAIVSLAALIADARARGVQLVLSYDSGVRWQRACFDAMAIFCEDGDAVDIRAA